MLIKKLEHAGTRLALGKEIVEVSKDGVADIKNEEIAQILIKEGWELVSPSQPAKREIVKPEEAQAQAEAVAESLVASDVAVASEPESQVEPKKLSKEEKRNRFRR